VKQAVEMRGNRARIGWLSNNIMKYKKMSNRSENSRK
jgi:hypothetical protein